MHKSMDLFALRNKFEKNLLNLWHIFDRDLLIVLIAKLDGKIWLNFSCLGASTVVNCID